MIIYIQEGQRRIPIQYASRVRGRRMYQGGSTFLPLRVNQAGVIPIIFAVSILLFPSQIAQYFTTSQVEIVAGISQSIVNFFADTRIYALMYFLLTVGFTYFYTAFTFKPDETAEQLRKNGGFIPGIRPGRPTQDYLARVVFRITVAGALFLGIVAVAPFIVSAILPNLGGLGLGGTGLLIVVSVVVETMKQIEAQLMMRNYEGDSSDESHRVCWVGPGPARGRRRRSWPAASGSCTCRPATCSGPPSATARRSGRPPRRTWTAACSCPTT